MALLWIQTAGNEMKYEKNGNIKQIIVKNSMFRQTTYKKVL